MDSLHKGLVMRKALWRHHAFRFQDVSENDLGTVGAREFMAVLEENEYLRSLKLSGNGFNDNDMHFFMDGMQVGKE